MVYTTPTQRLYQVRPKRRSRPACFQEHGWHTRDGHAYEADKLSRCVDWAKHRYFPGPFTWFVSVNVMTDMTASEMKPLWKRVCRSLQSRHVIALFTTEVSRRSNRWNFHLLLRSASPEIYGLLKAAFDSIPTNIKPDPYDPRKGRLAVRYMTKARTAKYRDGTLITKDRWQRKRVLLHPKDKVRRYGTIGDFWNGHSKESIWNEIKACEQKIAVGLTAPGVDEYAAYLHDLTQGFFTLERVRRSVGFFGVPKNWMGAPTP
jgi:hypothetical protein